MRYNDCKPIIFTRYNNVALYCGKAECRHFTAVKWYRVNRVALYCGKVVTWCRDNVVKCREAGTRTRTGCGRPPPWPYAGPWELELELELRS